MTVLGVYEDGYLSVSEQRRGKPARDYTLDLKFVDPSPLLSRYVATTMLQLALTSAGLSLLGATLVYFALWPSVIFPATLLATAAAAAAATVFVRTTQERIDFRTIHGRTVVLALTANIGCLRAYRRAIPKLVAAIRIAHRERDGDHCIRLREEMREHYRLTAAGLLTEQACAAATRRILNQFP
jgi:hypothetical protein